MNKNNKEQQIILVSNYGFKYAKDLKLDVSFEEIHSILIKSIKLDNINNYTHTDIEDIIEEYYSNILDYMEYECDSDFFEEEIEEEILDIEYEDEIEALY